MATPHHHGLVYFCLHLALHIDTICNAEQKASCFLPMTYKAKIDGLLAPTLPFFGLLLRALSCLALVSCHHIPLFCFCLWLALDLQALIAALSA